MTQTAKNYADALYELAQSEGLEEKLLPELSGVGQLFAQNPDYIRLLCAANVPKAERLSALDEAFSGRVHTYLLSFLKLLCERGHIRALPDCERRYRSRFNADHGILEATAVTASPLRFTLNFGTGRFLFTMASVAWSSNCASGAHSMRMRRSVSTVKRAFPATTCAPGAATGLFSWAKRLVPARIRASNSVCFIHYVFHTNITKN